MKKIFQILAMLLAVLFLPVMSDAAEMPSFHDGADIVKGEAAAEVKNALETVEKKHNVRIAVVTQPSVEGMKIGDYADKLLGTVIKGGEKGNMVLVLDMQERDWYIATDPKMKAMITNDIGIKLMKDAFVSKLSKLMRRRQTSLFPTMRKKGKRMILTINSVFSDWGLPLSFPCSAPSA